jgi:hypothetical protein
MCTVHCKRSFLYLILLRSARKRKKKKIQQQCSGVREEKRALEIFALERFVYVQEERLKKREELSSRGFFAAAAKKKIVWNSNGFCSEVFFGSGVRSVDNFSSLVFFALL